MPRLSAWYLRAALVHLALGFSIGALLLANKGVSFFPAVWLLLPLHIEFLLIGWTVQLALGVAFWILPRFWERPGRSDERGAWLAFGLLNLGVWLAAAGSLWPSLSWLLFAGRLAEAGAAVAFAWHVWPRVIPRL